MAAFAGRLAKKELEKHAGKGGGEKKLPTPAEISIPGAFKRGGKVKKTGWAKVHKGERVLTKKQQKRGSKRRSK